MISDHVEREQKLALWWEWSDRGAVRCLLCPHVCHIPEGGVGKCGIRKNYSGLGLISLNERTVGSMALDPVEKKPLFHFRPGCKVLSLGTVGCNLDCPFCQNWQLARNRLPFNPGVISPMAVLKKAREWDVDLVAFTYNEPTVWYELVLETARLLTANKIKVLLVTNGFIQPHPLDLLLPYVAAANVDVKAFTDRDYQKVGGRLEPVQETVKRMMRRGLHVELTYLAVPGINDDLQAFHQMVEWIAGLDPGIPLHITRYFPNYHWDRPPTAPERIDELVRMARTRLFYVYPGNVPGGTTTRCSHCGEILVRRYGYNVEVSGLQSDGRCSFCGAQNHFTLRRPKRID